MKQPCIKSVASNVAPAASSQIRRSLPGGLRHVYLAPEAELGNPDSFRTQIEFIIGKIPPDAEEIRLLTDENCRIERACETLDNFVRANYTIVEEQDFYKEKVRLLRSKEK
jgi:hypothetical protein